MLEKILAFSLLFAASAAFEILKIGPAVEVVKGEDFELSCVADQVKLFFKLLVTSFTSYQH